MALIIITDDEPMNLRMTEFLLCKNGYDNIIKARSGEECLLFAPEADLILMDVMMPSMDGLRTFHRLRETGLDTPVVFLTSSEDEETLTEIEATGSDMVSKPFSPEELIASVRKALGEEKKTFGGDYVVPLFFCIIAPNLFKPP